ncbi:hypothetical protein K443DRAFT_12055 [Laccaria amethystina LaAM-08-1]|uniref:Uncharacterized protein n=1 Tax=Laccaria amethystina LaAM-08-1 TaxID=1095629 RepID=A0A0C9WSA3_9AGAR|nr:hypothetical protein K443DRAFT_12055 [Laccaria amethystina LaAM-08-1]
MSSDISEFELLDLLFGKRMLGRFAMRKRGCASQPHLPPSLMQEMCAFLAKKSRLHKLANLESKTEIATCMCPDSSFDDDWPLYFKDETNRID